MILKIFIVIEWQKIKGFRNRIVHDYFGIDYSLVWIIIEKNIKILKFDLISIYENFEN